MHAISGWHRQSSDLGLLGLTAFTTAQRTKEIGIRKVLGASQAQITRLLARKMLVLVGSAAAIAAVISYVIMSRWLIGFAYRISVNP